MKYLVMFFSFLLGIILRTWLTYVYQEAGQMQATGEEWERISNGYVSD